MAKIKVGLIGYGYWGPNIARIINELDKVELMYCADIVNTALSQAKRKYPQLKITNNYHEILKDNKVSAVFIVTPIVTHYQIARDCLRAKKHVFCEKPLTLTAKEARDLVQLAKKNKVILAVGHVFLFNPVVRYIKKIIDDGTLGEIRYLHFQRRNLGIFLKDVNVMADLIPHDISMLLYFVKQKPISVMAIGESYLRNGVDDVVSATIKFEDHIMANMILSWIDPVKIRDITIVGNKKMLLFDDTRPDNKIKIFDKNATIIKDTRGVTFGEYQIALHAGDVYVPAIGNKEPLKEEIKHFIECIAKNKKPLNDGANGLEVVQLLERLQKSLVSHSMETIR